MKSAVIKGLNMAAILEKPSRVITTEDALRDIAPIEWPEKVRKGEKKVVADIPREEKHV